MQTEEFDFPSIDESHPFTPNPGHISLMTLAEAIEKVATDKAIETCIIGEAPLHWSEVPTFEQGATRPEIENWQIDERLERISGLTDQYLLWEVARPVLNWHWNDGYPSSGQRDCPPVFAWTKSWVIFITANQMGTAVHKLPRNPSSAEMPRFIESHKP